MGYIMSVESTYDQPDIRFEYDTEYEVSSKQSNRTRYTTLNFYYIKEGLYVCVCSGVSENYGEVNYVKYKVCHSIEDIVSFFKYSYLSKQLYRKLYTNLGLNFVDDLTQDSVR